MPPVRTQRGSLSMTSLGGDFLPYRYDSDSDSDSDTTSVGSPSSPTFSSSSRSFTLPITDDIRRIISYCPAAMKYCKGEVEPAFPYRKTTSHSAKRGANYIPRPPNAFFLFRSNRVNKRPSERRNNVLSQHAGKEWACLPVHEKALYKRAADVVNERHDYLYPQYKYTPSTEKKVKKARPGSKAKKGSKKGRSSKPRITVVAAPSPTPSPTPSFDEPAPQLAVPIPTFAMPSPTQSMTFEVPSVQSFAPEVEFAFTPTSQISPMMLPTPLIDDLAQKFAACKVVEPYNMAADESALIASDYTGELPHAMYDAPHDDPEYISAFPPMHIPTLTYSPESTPPPYDTSAPGWLAYMEAASLESAANDLFDEIINPNALF